MAVALVASLLVVLVSSFAVQAAEKIRISVSGGYNTIFLSARVAQHEDSSEIRLLAAFSVDLVDKSFLLDLAHNAVVDQTVRCGFACRILL